MSSVPARTLRRTAGTLATLLLVFAFTTSASAQNCGWTNEKYPSRAVVEELWNGLEPTELTGLSSDRDNTEFDGNGGYSHAHPFWRSIDAGDGYLMAGYNLGLHVFQASGSRQEKPMKVGTLKVEQLPVLHRNLHDYFLVTDVDVPDGESDVTVMTGWDGIGMVVVDTSDKARPRVLYQDGGDPGQKYGQGVYTTRIGGRLYGFLASQRFSGAGVWMYDLTRAQEVGDPFTCSEQRPTIINPSCSGVFQRKLTSDDVSHVDGAGSQALGHFVAVSGGQGGDLGLRIYNVSQPTAPHEVLTGFPTTRVDGIAMWTQGSKFYLAATLRNPDLAAIYDVTCIKNGCSSNPLNGTPLYEFPMPGAGSSTRSSVQISENGGVPYMYVGRSQSYKIQGLQAEWLFNVSDPANPVELTGGNPQNGNQGQPTVMVDGQEVGYFSWYSSCSTSGSNHFEPADARVMDGYLYRAGGSIVDVHRLKDVSPRLNVSAGAETYQNTAHSVSAQAFNCTPSAGGWTWNVGDGVVSGSGATVSVSWPTTGTKTVSASNTACGGAAVTETLVSVKQAAPSVSSVSRDVDTALVCSPVTFTANSVAGKPTISHSWQILDSGDNVVTTLPSTGTTAVWDTSAALPAAGTYRARYTASNSAGSSSKISSGVAISDTGPLGFSGAIGTSVSFGDVTFAANSTGATRWVWDFGDGTTLDTINPVEGPNPTHRYDAVGTYTVTVTISNCKGPDTQVNQGAAIVAEVNPLVIRSFEAVGSFGQFFFGTGQDISFTLDVDGDPDTFQYDWDGNGTFDQTSGSAVTTHAYSTPGSYRPIIKVSRGSATKTLQHAQALVINQSDPASISVSGPSSGEVGDSLTYTASFSNCTPASTWNWTATGGGNVSGSGKTVSISWSTKGSKSVKATNSACSGASGSRSVSITEEVVVNPNDLQAVFSASAVVVDVGDEVEFDASSSKGSPTLYAWDFGDGAQADSAKATHSWDEAGVYTVELTVSKPGSCPFGYCNDSASKQINVKSAGPIVGANGCTGDDANDADTLCLKDGRFKVDVAWRDQHNGNRTGVGGAKRHSGSEVTGFFWFFNPNNVELIVKILETAGGDHWVFYGGLSDVYYKMTVTDTETNQSKVYENLEGTICGKADTSAFLISEDEQGELQAGASSGALHFPATDSGVGVAHDAFRPELEDEEEEEDEEEPSDTLALLDGRFEVSVDWVNQHDGNATGVGTAVAGTNQTGYFWFFNEKNLEVVVKMVDGRILNGYWWVFWGGLSDTNYTVTVHDTVLDRTWTRTNPPGSFCGGSDNAAFLAD